MIEMMGEMVRRLCSIAREADAFREMNEISQRACGLPLDMLRSGDIDSLQSLMNEPQRFLAAQLLLVDHTIQSRRKSPDVLLPLLVQAIDLYATLREPDYLLPAGDKVAKLIAGNLANLPYPALRTAAGLLERAGLYADAEDAWFAALDQSPQLRPDILRFYDRLDPLGERALRTGGLSHDELLEGRAALG